ncbi:MAG: hypothetical protein ACPGZP_03950 [Panacagrimonas sp.]
MNAFGLSKNLLSAGVIALGVALAGCEADGGGNFPGGNGGNGDNGDNGDGLPGSPADIRNCEVPVGQSLCVVGGADHAGGLVDVLLDEDGPLGPIAGAIDQTALTDTLVTLLQNDGDLASIVEGLISDGQLQEGLEELLLDDGSGTGSLATLLEDLLLDNEDGDGLVALFGDSLPGLVEALLIEGVDPSCQAPLGTLCLITGDGNQMGLVDLLLTSDGALGALSPSLTGEVTDEIVATLGDLLESDGSLVNLLEGLFVMGHLADGLEVLLLGDPDAGTPSGLVMALEDVLGNLGIAVEEILDYVGGLLGLGQAPLGGLQ